jgi:arylsulfatase A-like enzyme
MPKKPKPSSGRRRLIAPLLLILPIAIAAIYWFGMRKPPRPNIVLITLESVRADHTGCYGYDRPTTPALDALAKEGVIYEDAHAVTSWTLPTHTSLFTGLYPSAHQVTGPFSRLDDKYTTIAEILSANGYQCGGVISGPYLKRAHGLHQGFSYYNESPAAESQSKGHSKVTCEEMMPLLRHFLTRLRDQKRPMFLFAYFWDPHYDYIPPAPYNRMFVTEDCELIDVHGYETANKVTSACTPGQLAYVISQYDGEIRWTDDHLKDLFEMLKARGLWDNTAIIVLGDHGDEFFEHQWKGHKNNLYTETIRIPLVIKYPNSRPFGRDARLVSQVDIFPTILELAGVETDAPEQGVSLLGPVPPSERSIHCELLSARYFPKTGGGWEARFVRNWYGARQGDYQLLHVAEEKRSELYNMRTDPQQHVNCFGQAGLPSNTLLSLIQQSTEQNQAIAKVFGLSGEAKLDESAIENLRSLGYVQ